LALEAVGLPAWLTWLFAHTDAVKDRDFPPVIMNQPARLQRVGGLGDTDAPNTEHVSEDFVRRMEFIRMRAVLRHEQTTGKPLLDQGPEGLVACSVRQRTDRTAETGQDCADSGHRTSSEHRRRKDFPDQIEAD
jgi:hypothetical protein